jgi:hypothetical protein
MIELLVIDQAFWELKTAVFIFNLAQQKSEIAHL